MKKILAILLCLGMSGCAESQYFSHVAKSVPGGSFETGRNSPQQGTFKVGKPYNVMGQTYVPTETYSYEETGIASWYGPGFHGSRTASGETFDTNELSAAHRTLQMPSFVRVTNLENGRSIIVRVNDRGPFAKNRVMDVSSRAADLLQMKGKGTARVKLQLLSEESRAVAEAAKRGVDTRGTALALNETGQLPDYLAVHKNESGVVYPDQQVAQVPVVPTGIFVQFGAFTNPDNANRLKDQIAGLGNSFVVEADVGGQHFYRVRIGPLQSVETADQLHKQVTAQGQNAILIVEKI